MIIEFKVKEETANEVSVYMCLGPNGLSASWSLMDRYDMTETNCDAIAVEIGNEAIFHYKQSLGLTSNPA